MTRLEWNYEWTPHSSRVLYKRARCGHLRRLLLSANKIPLRWLARVLIRLSLWRRLFLGNSVGSACTHRQFRPLFDRVRYRQHFCLSLYLTYSDIIPVMILFPMWFTSLVISYCNFLPNQWHSFFFFFRFFSPFKDKDSFDLFRFSSIFLKKKKKNSRLCNYYYIHTNDRCTFDNSLAKSCCSFVTRNLVGKYDERIFPENRSRRRILHF